MDIFKKIQVLKTQSYKITSSEGKEINIDREGSLGLFALGYRGIMAWKQIKDEKSSVNNAE